MNVKLPPAFQFSQTSLQDFVDCPRRFQLRHLMAQEWPAPPAEPLTEAEQVFEMGRRFHLLMERHWLGLPVNAATLDPALAPWWQAFVRNPLPGLPGTIRRPEVTASATVFGQRMTAKYDLLAYEPGGRAAIVDWKTGRRPARRHMDRRLQTVVYPLLLVEAAPRLLGHALAPEDVTLIYWFASEPDAGEIEVFPYSTARYEEDKRYLTALYNRLFSLDVAVWPLTPNEKLCRLCQYRSLCDRGREAGALDEDTGESWPDVDELRAVIASAASSDDFVL